MRYTLSALLFGVTIFGASLAVFGVRGLWLAVPVLGAWGYVFSRTDRPKALARAAWFVVPGFGLLLWAVPAVRNAREAASRTTCISHCKVIALALHTYHDVYGSFPPAYVADANGKPMHSWRVLLLPFLEEHALYKAYRFDEPWDGPNNSKLVDQMPRYYACCSRLQTLDDSWGPYTRFVAIVGPDAAWPGATGRKMSEFPGGTSNTVFIMETNATLINWMEPRDFDVDQAIHELADWPQDHAEGHGAWDFFYDSPPRLHCAFADGSSIPLPPLLEPEKLRPLFCSRWLHELSAIRPLLHGEPNSILKPLPRLRRDNVARLAAWVALALLPLAAVWR